MRRPNTPQPKNRTMHKLQRVVLMSSWVVSNEVINAIATGISSNQRLKNNETDEEIYKAFKVSYDDEQREDKLVRALLKMNVSATSQRYGGEAYETLPGRVKKTPINKLKYEYTPTSLIQLLKYLQCYLYQCSEGNIPNTKRYKILKDIETSLMFQVIDALPEYEKARWG